MSWINAGAIARAAAGGVAAGALGLLLLPASLARASGSTYALFQTSLHELRGVDGSLARVRSAPLPRAAGRTGCGLAPEGDLVVFYCPRDRTVYALPSSVASVARRHGTAGVRYLAAHEMAHGRQHAVTGFASEIVKTSVLDELQADCIAGTYLNRLYGYTVESAEGRQALDFAYSIGDRAFYTRDWHGNPRLRVAALARGLRQGDPARCLSSSRFNYGSLLQSGAALLRELRRR